MRNSSRLIALFLGLARLTGISATSLVLLVGCRADREVRTSPANPIVVSGVFGQGSLTELPTPQKSVQRGNSLENETRVADGSPKLGYCVGGVTKGQLGSVANWGGGNGRDAYVARFDAQYNLLWEIQLGRLSEGNSEVASKVRALSNGGCEVWVHSDSGATGWFLEHYTLSEIGGIVSTETIFDFVSLPSSYAYDIDPDDNFLYIFNLSAGKLFLSKFSRSIGAIIAQTPIWDVEFRGTNIEAVSVVPDSNGFVYVAGIVEGPVSVYLDIDGDGVSTRVKVSEQEAIGGKDIFIAQFDEDGKMVWLRQIGSTLDDVVTSLVGDGQFRLFMTGSTLGNFVDNHIAEDAKFDGVILALDVYGNQLWGRQFGAFGGEVTGVRASLGVLGNLYVSATVEGDIALGTLQGMKDFYVSKINANGELSWETQFGSTENDFAQGVYNAGETDLLLLGSTEGDFLNGVFQGVKDAVTLFLR